MTVDRYDRTILDQLVAFQPQYVILNLSGNDITSTSRPTEIAARVGALTEYLTVKGVERVFFVDICERGSFKKDGMLTKKSFNSQRKKINKLVSQMGVGCIKCGARFPKDYNDDKVHLNAKGHTKLFYCIRKVIASLKK